MFDKNPSANPYLNLDEFKFKFEGNLYVNAKKKFEEKKNLLSNRKVIHKHMVYYRNRKKLITY